MARPRKYNQYCDPHLLHLELLNRTKTGVTSETLGKMYQDIIKGIMSRPNFSGYYGELKDEMEFVAIHNLVKYTNNYKPIYYETNKNAAFTYCSRIVFQCFTMTITSVKKRNIKDEMYMDFLITHGYEGLSEEINNQIKGEYYE